MINISIYNAIESLEKLKKIYDNPEISIDIKHQLKSLSQYLSQENDFYNEQMKNIINDFVSSGKAKIENGKLNFEISQDESENLKNYSIFSEKTEYLKNYQVYFAFPKIEIFNFKNLDSLLTLEDLENLKYFIEFKTS